MVIQAQDTDGIKRNLLEGEFGYDRYEAGGDRGRVYIGTPYGNMPLAKLTEVYTRTQIQESLPAIGLDTTNIIAPTRVGQFRWNQDEGTADLVLENGVTLQVGQENNKKVRNTSGATILNGRLVKSVSSIGNSGRITVAPFTGLVGDAKYLFGVVTHDILNGEDGYATTSGKVRGINTTGASVGETWLDGQLLYAKPNDSGMMTNVVPADNELKIVVARVVHAHTSGTLDIDIHSIIDENAPAKSATKLTTARTINGTSFDGTANITISDATKLPLSGGTLTGPVVAIREKRIAMPASNIDLATGNLFTKTITATTTFTISNILGSDAVNSFILVLTNAGAYTVNLWVNIKWAGGIVPTFTTAGVDWLGFVSYDNGATWTGMVLPKDAK